MERSLIYAQAVLTPAKVPTVKSLSRHQSRFGCCGEGKYLVPLHEIKPRSATCASRFIDFWLQYFSKLKFRVFWDVEPCSHIKVERRFILSTAFIITLMMEALLTSETSVNFVTTWHYIPKDSNFILATMRT
jgi:hypothetical protein